MEKLLNQLGQIDAKVHSLRKICKQNNLDVTILNKFNTKKVRDIYSRILKHYNQQPEKAKTLWFQSQLKLYNWVLICYSLVFSKRIQNYNQQDWDFFKQVFTAKDLYTFKYQARRLSNDDSKNSRVWNPEEDSILTTIMEDEQMKNRWNQTARKFYQMSNQNFFRTGKQCREHWLNHLDPSKKHGKWKVQQDLIILKFVISSGKKWSNISKDLLAQRTQHMIKNRFKSLISKFRKHIYDHQTDENCIVKELIKKLQSKEDIQLLISNSAKYDQKEMAEEKISIQKNQQVIKIEMEEEGIKEDMVSKISEIKQKNELEEINQEKGLNCNYIQKIDSPNYFSSDLMIGFPCFSQSYVFFVPFLSVQMCYNQM